MSAELKDLRSVARAFAEQHVSALAAEILDWQDTGLLCGGVDGQLRELGALCATFAGEHHMQVAESMVKRAALQLVVRATPAPGAPGQEAAAVQAVGAADENKDYPFYELRFIMRVLSHKGRAPEQDWETAHGMAKEIFSKWHAAATAGSQAVKVGTVAVPIGELVKLRRSAARYDWLRAQTWGTSDLFVVAGGKSAIRLGAYCPCLENLDQKIDAALPPSGAGEKTSIDAEYLAWCKADERRMLGRPAEPGDAELLGRTA